MDSPMESLQLCFRRFAQGRSLTESEKRDFSFRVKFGTKIFMRKFGSVGRKIALLLICCLKLFFSDFDGQMPKALLPQTAW